MFGDYITLTDSLFITVLSITIVFVILLLIALAITSFKYIFKEETTIKNEEPLKKDDALKKIVNLDDVVKDENMLVATLVASIESNNNDEDKKYRVLSIKEI